MIWMERVRETYENKVEKWLGREAQKITGHS